MLIIDKMSSSIRSDATFTVHQKPEIGDTKISMKGQDHTGWLKCDGRLMDKCDYKQLFNVIGTSYGGTSIAFNLPRPM